MGADPKVDGTVGSRFVCAGKPNPERQARYRWAAEVAAGSRVLDAACGGGWGTSMLAKRAASAVGVDLSPAAIFEAQRQYGEHAEFREADVCELPFADAEFDYVTCFEGLAQVADAEQALDEMRRVLRRGGALMVSSPNRDVYPAGNPLHRNELSSEELESLLAARFANVAIHRQQSFHASLLGTAALLAAEDPAAEIRVHVVKSAGRRPGAELHAVAAASDAALPPAPAWLAIGEDADYEEQGRQLGDWQRRAVGAEAEAEALRKELRALQR